jgi:putative ABC transport system permease protein
MLWETFLLAQREIRRNVLRSALTVLGVVIGVAAVITMVTLGSGATAKVTSDISKLGSNMLQVRVGQGFGRGGGARIDAPAFKMVDAGAIEREISGLRAVAPVSLRSGQAIMGNINWATTITGSTDAYLDVRNWALVSGRAFSEGEMRSGQSVVLLGATVRDKLFGGEDPVGTTIRLGKTSFRVIGALEAKGQSSFGTDQDDFVLIPMRTFQRRIAGNTHVGSIMVSAQDGISTEKVKADIEELLRERRGITRSQEDNFHVRDMQEIIATMTSSTAVLTALLGAVAAVSLLVGGIGIMNIMLVSVTERTREIGTRLAIGALERQVMLQFLVEAVVLAGFGGLIGIGLGLGGAAVGAGWLQVPFIFNLQIVLAAFFFSCAVGIVFGYYPALKAARLNPIDALRHE